MKRLEVTTLIKECSDCPYGNTFGMFCNKSKRKLPEMDVEGYVHYIIPDWCELDNLSETDGFTPELTICYYNNGTCEGISCSSADHDTSVRDKDTHQIKFKCKKYGVWISRE